jgi:hypothetical protein
VSDEERSVMLTVDVRIRDIERFSLFLYELQTLRDEMRVMASPHTERIERIIDRFVEGGDDEGVE